MDLTPEQIAQKAAEAAQAAKAQMQEMGFSKNETLSTFKEMSTSNAIAKIKDLNISNSRKDIEYIKRLGDIAEMASNAATKEELDGLRIREIEFQGPDRALEGTTVQVKITNFNAENTYTISEVSHGSATRVQNIITWVLPSESEVQQDTNAELKITASANGKADRTNTFALMIDNYDGVADQVALYENSTMSTVEYDELNGAVIENNKIKNTNTEEILTIDSSSTNTEVIVQEEIQEGDVLNIQGKRFEVQSVENVSTDTTGTLDIFGDGSCIACYPLDGDANDLSGNYNGTWSGTEAYEGGKFGQGVKINDASNGTDSPRTSFIAVPGLTTQSNSTFSCWFKSLDTGKSHSIFSSGDDAGNTLFYFYIRDNGDIHLGKHGTGEFTPSINANDGNFHHLSYSIDDGKVCKLYIDGILVNTQDIDLGSQDANTSTLTANYDHNYDSPDRSASFYGILDQVRFFNKALNEEEIQKLLNEQSQAHKLNISSLNLSSAPTSIIKTAEANATSTVLNQETDDNEWVGYQVKTLQDANLFTITDGTKDSITLRPQSGGILENDKIILAGADGNHILFDCTGHYTNNGDGTYTINISSTSFTEAPKYAFRNTANVQVSLVDTAAGDEFRTMEVQEVTSDFNGSLIEDIDPFGDGSLVAKYLLNGNAKDLTGNYDGTWFGTELYDNNGKFGSSIDVIDAGTCGKVSGVDFSVPGTRTISLWANRKKYNNENNYLFDCRVNDQQGCLITNSDLGIDNCIVKIDTNSVADGDSIPSDNVWHHYIIELSEEIQDFTLGYYSGKTDSHDYHFGGSIDHVEIFNRILTQDEVQTLYTQESNKIPTELEITYKKEKNLQGRDLKHKVQLPYNGDTIKRVQIDLEKDA